MVRRRADEAHPGGGVPNRGDPGPDLVAGQLAALAGLGALGHLYLEFVGVDKVLARDAKAAGGDLLDRTAAEVAVGVGLEAATLFAAFAGIAAPADAVHGDREGLVRFGGNRAVRHGASREALENGLDRLDLIERHGRAGGLEDEEATERGHALALVIDEFRVLAKDLLLAGAGGVLEPEDRLGVKEMELAIAAPLVLAAPVQLLEAAFAAWESAFVVGQGLFGDFEHTDPADARDGLREVVIDELFVQADSFEDLGAAVTLDRGDAHLGHDLHDALLDRLQVVLDGLVLIEPALNVAIGDEMLERIDGEVGVDRAGAVANEQSVVVHLARVGGLDDETDLGTLLYAHQVVVEPGDGQEHWDRSVVRVHSAVGEDKDLGAEGHGPVGGFVNGGERGGEARRASGGREQRRQHGGAESVVLERSELRHLVVVEEGRIEADEVAVLRLGVEEVALGADDRLHGRDELFAYGVEGRVRDLGEELLEVVVEGLRAVREHGEGRVGAHRADRFFAILRHRAEDVLVVLERVAEGDLLGEQLGAGKGIRRFALGGVFEGEQVVLEPLGVRPFLGEFHFEFGIVDDAAFIEADEEHLAGLEAALREDPLGLDGEDADLGGHDDQVVLRDDVARWAEAVAVEHRADVAPVGEGDGGGAVPGFHEAAVVFVEGFLGGGHRFVRLPGLRDEHHHHLGDGAAGAHEEFDGVVEAGRVRAGFVDNGQDLVDIFEARRGHQRFAGGHPVDVAAQGVDFAIVRNHAVGVGERPTGEGVRAEARVEHAERADVAAIAKVGEVFAQLERGQHSFIDDGAGAEAGEVEVLVVFDAVAGDELFKALADDVEAAFEVVFIRDG